MIAKMKKLMKNGQWAHVLSALCLGAAFLMVSVVGCKKESDEQEPEQRSQPSATTRRQPSTGTPSRPPGASGAKRRGVPPGANRGHLGQGGPRGRPAPKLDKKTLSQYVKAHKKAKAVQDSYERKLSRVQDADKARKLQKEVAEAVRKAVKEAGMDFRAFLRISQQVRNNPALQRQIAQQMQRDQ